MGAEHSIALNQRRTQGGPIDSLFERAVLDALHEIAEESSVPSEQIEHAWDPEDCSPRFRVLSDRLTARRLPSPLTTDGIRGTQNLNVYNGSDRFSSVTHTIKLLFLSVDLNEL